VEADLAEIWAYLATEASEVIATRFVDAIEAKFAPLLSAPLMGAKREQATPKPLRTKAASGSDGASAPSAVKDPGS
jgi:plasmid stabilization system protein ParE